MHAPKIENGFDIHRPTIDMPTIDLHWIKIDEGLNIHRPKIGVPSLNIHGLNWC